MPLADSIIAAAFVITLHPDDFHFRHFMPLFFTDSSIFRASERERRQPRDA